MATQRYSSDVVIVGAGPAGCAAAITARRAGLDVVLLERSAFPRALPGETLHPGVEALLTTLDVGNELRAADFPRFAGHWVGWAGPPRFESFGRDAAGAWRGYQASRDRFDAILLARARAAGATVVQPAAPVRLLARDGQPSGVAEADRRWHGRLLIDATGRQRVLGRQLGVPVRRYGPRRIVWYGYAEGNCPARQDAPLLQGDADGWTWTACVSTHRYHWAHWSCRQIAPAAEWLPDELRGLRSTGPPRAADMTWRMCQPAATAGLMLVGDAAAVLDPVSGHGVLRALMTGMMAGHLAGAVAGGAVSAAEAARSYHRWINDWFRHDVQRLRSLYAELAPGARGVIS